MATHQLARQRQDAKAHERARSADPATPAAESTGPVAEPAPVAGLAPDTGLAPNTGLARWADGTAADPLGGAPAPDQLLETLRRRRGQGEPLSPEVAGPFGEQLGTDLSGVRVHTDAEADGIARSVDAVAFTHGEDVYFTGGSYAPGAEGGQHLLAHELAHVAQHRSGRFAAGGGVIGRADDPAETSAEADATRVVAALRGGTALHGPADSDTADSDTDGPEAAGPAEDTGAVRRFVGAKPRRRLQIGGHRGAPTPSGPVIGGHRRGTEPAPEEKESGEQDGEESLYNNVDEDPLRGSGSFDGYSVSPALEEKEAGEQDGEESLYNNFEDALHGGGGFDGYSSPALEEKEAGEHEGSESLYDVIEENPLRGDAGFDGYSSPALEHGYSTPIPAPDEKEAGEQEGEGSHYSHYTSGIDLDALLGGGGGGGGGHETYSTPIPAPDEKEAGEQDGEGSNYSYYTSGTDIAALLGGAGGGSGGGHETYSTPIPAPDEKESGEQESGEQDGEGSNYSYYTASTDVEALLGGGGGGGGGAPGPQPDAPGPRAGGRHRAWVVSGLGPAYTGEEGSSKQELASAIEPQVKLVGVFWRALELLKNPGADGGVAARKAALDLVQAEAKGFYPRMQPLAFPELVQAIKAAHFRFYEGLKRQDFPIHEDGVMDMPRTPMGELDMSVRKVKYDRGEEQERTVVDFAAGKLVRGPKAEEPGKAVDTTDSVTHFSGPGYEIFVVGEDGDIHMAAHKVGKYHHSSLLAGADVALGGEMKVKDGKIEAMSNKSGHYMPGVAQFQQFLHHLQKDGIDLNFPITGFGVKAGLSARQLHDGVDEDGDVDEAKSYHARKLRAVWRGYEEEYDEDQVEAAIKAKGWTGDEDGVEDEHGDAVDPKLVIHALKEHFGRHAQRKRRIKESPNASAKTSWRA